ncbi:MAG: hypothetical protein AAFX08_02055 [Pseudomonadota bacterium]
MRKSTFIGALAALSICSVCGTAATAKPTLPPAHVFTYDRTADDSALVAAAMTTGLRMDAGALCGATDVGAEPSAGQICLAGLVADARAEVARALKIDLAREMERRLHASE